MPPVRNKRLLFTVVIVAAVAIAILPALVAYRYTAPEQRGEFLRQPWRGWTFAFAALTVPADSKLKTSGMAARKANWMFEGSAVDPQEVQLVYTEQDQPHTFRHSIGSRALTSTVTPSYRFLWQVRGTLAGARDTDIVVAIFDYETGKVLYDVRSDLLPWDIQPVPTGVPPSAAPSSSPSPTD
jgi:hypothetical protein